MSMQNLKVHWNNKWAVWKDDSTGKWCQPQSERPHNEIWKQIFGWIWKKEAKAKKIGVEKQKQKKAKYGLCYLKKVNFLVEDDINEICPASYLKRTLKTIKMSDFTKEIFLAKKRSIMYLQPIGALIIWLRWHQVMKKVKIWTVIQTWL